MAARPIEDGHAARKCTGWLVFRYVLTTMLFSGYFLIYATRFNISTVLVAIVTKKSSVRNFTRLSECINSNVSSISDLNETSETWKTGEFDWDQRTQGIILSSFFYGYVITQIPGGRLAEMFGAKIMIFLSVFFSGFFALLTPAAARGGLPALITVRLLMGMAQGVVFPSAYLFYARWWPYQQRSMLMAVCSMGISISNVVTPVITALLCKHGFSGGWPSSFYVLGMLTFPWCGLWLWIVHDFPEFHPSISSKELQHILENRALPKQIRKKPKVPWRHLLTSMPVWSLVIKDFCSAASGYMILTKLPAYLDTAHGVSLQKNGIFNSMVHGSSFVTPLVVAFFADMIIRKQWLRVTTTRKLFGGIADIAPAICLALVPLAGCNTDFVFAMLICTAAMGRFDNAGLYPNTVEVAPKYAGTVKGIVNFSGNLQGIITPMVVSEFVQSDVSLASWSKAFYFTASLSIAGVLFYLIFGSAEPQPWSLEPEEAVSNKSEKKPSKDPYAGAELVNALDIKDTWK